MDNKKDFTFYDLVKEADEYGKADFYWAGVKHSLSRAWNTEDKDPYRFYITKERYENDSYYLCNVDQWNSDEMVVYTYLFACRANAVIYISDVSLTADPAQESVAA